MVPPLSELSPGRLSSCSYPHKPRAHARGAARFTLPNGFATAVGMSAISSPSSHTWSAALVAVTAQLGISAQLLLVLLHEQDVPARRNGHGHRTVPLPAQPLRSGYAGQSTTSAWRVVAGLERVVSDLVGVE